MSQSYVDVGNASGRSGRNGGSLQRRAEVDDRAIVVEPVGASASLQATVLQYPEEEVQFEDEQGSGFQDGTSEQGSAVDEALTDTSSIG
ncbi:hypothetical protein ACA910_002997 [Epithemia clementina (nom. ined.)]